MSREHLRIKARLKMHPPCCVPVSWTYWFLMGYTVNFIKKEILEMTKLDFWLIIGFTGQILFSMRFIIQWLKTEKEKRSVIPIEFWYFSIAGGVTLLAYSIHRRDPVFIVGNATGLFIYARNLYFIFKEKKKQKAV